MCKYCNFDVFTHYVLNSTSILKDDFREQGEQVDRNTFIPNESDFPINLKTDSNLQNINYISVSNVELNNTNNPPIFNEKNWDFDGSRERLYGQVAIVDRAFSWTFTDSIFSDEDGDILTYSATLVNGDPLPAWLTINSNTSEFTGTPDSIGSLDIKLIATDTNGESDSVNFTLDILDNNVASSSNPGGISNNLQLWLRGDTGVVETDGIVSAWLDQSSNNFYGSQGIESYRPTINNNGLNGKPTLNFAADTLLNRGLLGEHLDVNFDRKLNPDEFTVFIISSVDGGEGSWRSPLSSRGSGTGYNFYAGTNNSWQFWTGNGSGWNNVSGTAPVTLNEWELITGAYDGTNQSLLLDGKQIRSSSKTYVPNNTTAPLRIGGFGSNFYGNFSF